MAKPATAEEIRTALAFLLKRTVNAPGVTEAFWARDIFLELCGFSDYTHYLTSDLWASIQGSLRSYSWSKQCLACGARVGLQWHHRDYYAPTLLGNFRLSEGDGWGSPVVRLCSRCHRLIHYDEAGGFILDVSRTERRLTRLPDELEEEGGFCEGWDNETEPYDGFD